MQPKAASKRKTQTARSVKQQKREFTFPLEKQNFMIIGLGILVLIIGYILMSANSVDGFLPTVAAPILLIFGYCIIIPYGILKKTKIDAVETPETTVQSPANTVSSNVSSNIKTS